MNGFESTCSALLSRNERDGISGWELFAPPGDERRGREQRHDRDDGTEAGTERTAVARIAGTIRFTGARLLGRSSRVVGGGFVRRGVAGGRLLGSRFLGGRFRGYRLLRGPHFIGGHFADRGVGSRHRRLRRDRTVRAAGVLDGDLGDVDDPTVTLGGERCVRLAAGGHEVELAVPVAVGVGDRGQ